MSTSNRESLLSIAAFVLSAAWVVAWSAGLLVEDASLALRLSLFACGLTLASGSVALLLHRARRHREAVEAHIEALCQIDPRDLRSDTALSQVPPLGPDNPWHSVAQRLRAALVEHCDKVRELEHSKTALEIRCRRANAECQRVKAIVGSLSDPVIAVDEFNEVVLANPSAESLFHFDSEHAERRAMAQLVRCEKLVGLLASAVQRNGNGPRTDEIELVDDDGRADWYRVTACKLPREQAADSEAAGRGGGAVAVLRDIGDQKALQRRNAEFVSAVSHEMKTPLAGIKAYVELLVDGDADDEETREEFLNVIDSQADRLQRLVNNMLNLARIEAGVVQVNKANRSLNELLEESLHVVQPAAEAKRIELVSELSSMYLGVLADRDMLLQAAINLLSNAIKYTPESGKVTLRSRLIDNQVRFEVQDTGVGLSEEDCQKVFEKFYRVNKNKEMAAGTGLGLPLAKHIVEDVHGGTLTVQSAEGEGSTFSITLPVAGQMS